MAPHFYDENGRRIAKLIAGESAGAGQLPEKFWSISYFTNACVTGEPLAVRRYTSTGDVHEGTITYQHDDRGRVIDVLYDGEAANEFGLKRRVLKYCD